MSYEWLILCVNACLDRYGDGGIGEGGLDVCLLNNIYGKLCV